jgi:hypothetical protein
LSYPKTTWLEKIGKEVSTVLVAIGMKISNTSSLTAPLLKRFGESSFFATNLNQPRSISHMFGTWLNNQHKKIKGLIWVGTTALCWVIWRCRNERASKGRPHSNEQEIRDYCFRDLK